MKKMELPRGVFVGGYDKDSATSSAAFPSPPPFPSKLSLTQTCEDEYPFLIKGEREHKERLGWLALALRAFSEHHTKGSAKPLNRFMRCIRFSMHATQA